jgi:hypothetical protein
MKLHILNDLHIEFGDFVPPATDADVVILAGDIGVGLGALPWVDRCFPDKPVIYVPGNHEYYHHDLNLIEAMKHEAPEHVHVPDNDAVEIIGAASWPRWFVTAIAPEGGVYTLKGTSARRFFGCSYRFCGERE